VTIILTTHYLEEAEAMCDRIGIINERPPESPASRRRR
jgi:ABC-type multidrug transport system ATPase subunit